MKKVALLLVSIFMLYGCEQKELELNPNINSESGIYDYIYGDDSEITNIEVKNQQGNVYKGIVDDGFYQVEVPSLGIDQNVVVTYSNDKQEGTSEIKIPAKEVIDDYESFSLKMNIMMFGVNPSVKTEFPDTLNDGFQDIAVENGVTTTVNVYDGKIIGLELKTEHDIDQELATILVAFQNVYEASSDSVSDAYNNTLETREKNSFTSNGFTFTFDYSGETLFASVIKN